MPYEDPHAAPRAGRRRSSGKPALRTLILRAGLAAVAGLLTLTVPAHASVGPSVTSSSAPYLPEPTGPHPVGTTSLRMNDTSRPDPWVPKARSRELMVSLWYPARSTALAEELASRGYVVAGIDHTYETFATTFPDGRLATCAACELEGVDDFGAKAVENRAVDVSFVIDQLTGPHAGWKGASLIDASRIAMAGASLGGASAAETMLKDSRVRAGINLDGLMFAPIPPSGLARPFLFLGQPLHSPGGEDVTWDRDWEHLSGWKRWLVVAGAVHPSFSDYDLLAQQIGVDLGSALAGSRSVDITRRYVRAFFDLHLRGEPQPLLDRPSVRYPEVGFCSPEKKTCA